MQDNFSLEIPEHGPFCEIPAPSDHLAFVGALHAPVLSLLKSKWPGALPQTFMYSIKLLIVIMCEDSAQSPLAIRVPPLKSPQKHAL